MSRLGHLDGTINDLVYGWIAIGDGGSPDVSVEIDVDGRWQFRTIAAISREDLVSDNGSPFGYGFEAALPEDAQDGASHLICVRRTDTGQELPGSPKRIIIPSLTSGHIGDIIDRGLEIHLPVKAVNDTRTDLSVTVDGDTAYSIERLPALAGESMAVWRTVRVLLPNRVFDGLRHTLAVSVGGLKLTGQPFQFQSRYLGALDGLEAGFLRGWAVDLSRPNEPLTIQVYVDGVLAATTTADDFHPELSACGYGNGRHAFALPLHSQIERLRACTIRAEVEGAGFELSGSPIAFTGNVDFLCFLQDAAAALRYLATTFAEPGRARIHHLASEEERGHFLDLLLANANSPNLLRLQRLISAELRKTTVGQAVFPIKDLLSPPSATAEFGTTAVDVIIPVYKGLQETLNCIDSVLAAQCQTPHEVICILDNPGDSEMRQNLEHLYAGKITLLKNHQNLGFVKTVNRGMKLHPGRDVLLLNSDTIVHHDWLDRLRRSARSSPEIGTVTPFSNRATICSYPKFAEDNELPADSPGGELDAFCLAANAGEVVDIPTAVGFCMYIKRECLDEIGFFNEEAFGKGYGEENDFCRRAAENGWRNVMAVDTFVEHLGSVSFQESKNALAAKNLEVLQSIYPYYHGLIHTFISADPIRPWRRRIDVLRLSRAGKPVFCLVSHDLGGGTLVHIQHLSKQLESAGVLVLVLRCSSGGRVSIRTEELRGIDNLVYDLPGEAGQLLQDLRRIGVSHFHFHSNINIPQEVCNLPSSCGTSYDCTVHDYSWLCPRVHLVDATRVYCKEPSVEACEQCVSVSGCHPQWKLSDSAGSVTLLREHSAALLSGARSVFCPSEDVRRRITRHFCLTNTITLYHSEPAASLKWRPALPTRGERLRVGILGAIGIEKGSEVLRRCAHDAWKRELPLDFVVIGYTDDDGSFRDLPNVRLTGKYSADELPELLNRHQPHLSFFPAVWPETFSYTLSIALQCGLFPVAFDLGAIAERIRAAEFGELLPLDLATAPQCINERLLACGLALSSTAKPHMPLVCYPDILSDYYGFGSRSGHARAALNTV